MESHEDNRWLDAIDSTYAPKIREIVVPDASGLTPTPSLATVDFHFHRGDCRRSRKFYLGCWPLNPRYLVSCETRLLQV